MDPDVINGMFADFERSPGGPDCDAAADTLASRVFRFMMLDEGLLAASLRGACQYGNELQNPPSPWIIAVADPESLSRGVSSR